MPYGAEKRVGSVVEAHVRAVGAAALAPGKQGLLVGDARVVSPDFYGAGRVGANEAIRSVDRALVSVLNIGRVERHALCPGDLLHEGGAHLVKVSNGLGRRVGPDGRPGGWIRCVKLHQQAACYLDLAHGVLCSQKSSQQQHRERMHHPGQKKPSPSEHPYLQSQLIENHFRQKQFYGSSKDSSMRFFAINLRNPLPAT